MDLKDRSELNFSIGIFPEISVIEDSVLFTQKEQLVFISKSIYKPFAISGALAASLMAIINKNPHW